MIRIDPDRRLMKEMLSIALDVRSRRSGIAAAQKEKPALFNHELVKGMMEFGEEGLRQRGGSVNEAPISSNSAQVAEEFTGLAARVDTLCAKLRRGRFSRNPLVVAGLAIHGGGED
ncbi:MAG: hypothetical protein HUU06_06625 [Planctomycetaceae bacterium]|nr:hypothetical protein [Planctomycetota bacterium]NUN52445.1 hypothetical protein [Planctomycetaceae bacterium]